MYELYQKKLISEYDIDDLRHHLYKMRHSSTHWLDSLVHMQSYKSSHVCARTFETLSRYSLTEVGKKTQAKDKGKR